MELKIFNVGHGFCAYLVADNGNTMLFDCGSSDELGFSPSDFLVANRARGIAKFVVTNYDEDHLRDLPNLRAMKDCSIQLLVRNTSINVDQLRSLKRQGGIGSGMSALLTMMGAYTVSALYQPDYPGVEYRHFWNSYPVFDDTNNLSVVTFIHYRDLHIVLPGDLEEAGWLQLLQKEAFRKELGRVNVFVASHHGRENGYCAEVFDYCKPAVIVVSDEEKQYDTQDTDYSQHASGVRWGDGRIRRVLTTRSDGHITIRQGSLDQVGQIEVAGAVVL